MDRKLERPRMLGSELARCLLVFYWRQVAISCLTVPRLPKQPSRPIATVARVERSNPRSGRLGWLHSEQSVAPEKISGLLETHDTTICYAHECVVVSTAGELIAERFAQSSLSRPPSVTSCHSVFT